MEQGNLGPMRANTFFFQSENQHMAEASQQIFLQYMAEASRISEHMAEASRIQNITA